MKDLFIKIYRFVFARKALYELNLHIYKLVLRSVGVLNSEGFRVTGEENLFENVLSKNKINTVFDVGASRGNYAIMVRRYFPKAKIYSFEPHTESFQILKEKADKHNLKVFNIGLSSKSGKSKLWDYIKEDKTTNLTFPSIYKEVIKDVHRKKARSQTIKLTTIEMFAKKNKIKQIDLLKVDTEGNELNILKGASSMIDRKKIKVIQFEFNEMNVVSKVFIRDFIKLLSGYKLFRLQMDGLLPITRYDPKIHEIFAFQNFVAFSPSFTKKLKL